MHFLMRTLRSGLWHPTKTTMRPRSYPSLFEARTVCNSIKWFTRHSKEEWETNFTLWRCRQPFPNRSLS